MSRISKKTLKIINNTPKYYYVRAEIEEGYPDYEFVIKAKCLDEAIELAKSELSTSYPYIFVGKYADNFYCTNVNGQELLDRMCIN